jgi:hypothetical protein
VTFGVTNIDRSCCAHANISSFILNLKNMDADGDGNMDGDVGVECNNEDDALQWDDEIERLIVSRIEEAERNDVPIIEDMCDFCGLCCGKEGFIDAPLSGAELVELVRCSGCPICAAVADELINPN